MILVNAIRNKIDPYSAHTAAGKGEVVRLLELIEVQPSLITNLNDKRHTPLYEATVSSEYGTMALLLDSGNADPHKDKRPTLRLVAARTGNISSLRLLTLYSHQLDEDIAFWLRYFNIETEYDYFIKILQGKHRLEKAITENFKTAPVNTIKLGRIYLELTKLEWKARCKNLEEGYTGLEDQYQQLIYFYLGKALTEFIKAANHYAELPNSAVYSINHELLQIVIDTGNFCWLKLENVLLAKQFFATTTLLEQGAGFPETLDTKENPRLWIDQFKGVNAISDY